MLPFGKVTSFKPEGGSASANYLILPFTLVMKHIRAFKVFDRCVAIWDNLNISGLRD